MADYYSTWITPPSGGAAYQLHLIVNEVSQNRDTNTGTCEWQLLIEKDQSYNGFYGSSATWSVTLNGTVVGSATEVNPSAAWTDLDAVSIASSDDYGTLDVVHALDGTKTITVAASYAGANSGYVIGTRTISDTLLLDQIDRSTVPVVDTPTALTGQTVAITTTADDASFTHDITWESGTLSGTVATGVTTGTTWAVPNVSSEFSGDLVGPIAIKVTTKSAGVAIGFQQITMFGRFAAPTVALDVHDPLNQFDVRVRLVEWVSGHWVRTRILPASVVTLVEAGSATATLSIKLDATVPGGVIADWSVVDVDVYDGVNWTFSGHRFVLSRVEDDQIDATKMNTYSGIEFVDYELQFLYAQKDAVYTGTKAKPVTKTNKIASSPMATPGDILIHQLALAKNRHWGPRVTWDFSGAKSSAKNAWLNNKVDLTISAGTPFSQVLSGMVDDGKVEYRSKYSGDLAYLQLFNPGTGADFSAKGANPVVNLSLLALDSAPRRASVESRLTRVTVIGDGNVRTTREITPFDANVFGQMEGWVAASGVKSGATAAAIAKRAIADNKSATSERTFAYKTTVATKQYYPFVVFHCGDWILVPDGSTVATDADTAKTIPARVSQITVDKQVDGITITVLTGDRILSGTAKMAKRQAASVGSSIAGGTLTSPATVDGKTPLAPASVAISGLGYWDTDGAAKSAVTLMWPAVTKDTTGATIAVTNYEVWSRAHGIGADYALLGLSATPTINVGGFDVLKDLDFRVRAQSAAGVFSDFSPDQEFITLAPAVNIDGPDIADLYTDGVGSIYIVWGGYLNGSPAPARLAYVVAEVSTDAGSTYTTEGTPITGAGTIVLNKGGVWGDYIIRLRGYDRLGNAGTASPTQTITIIDPHITPPIPNAPTGLTATPGADWDASGFLPMAWFDLSWTAPTLDVSGNSVAIVGYDVYGLRSDETIERYLTTSATNAVRFPVGNGETWTFRVSATSIYGGISDQSDPFSDTADATISAASAPTPPTLDQYAGMLRIIWAGGGMVPQIKYAYAMISTSSGGTYVRTGAILNGAGEVAVPGLATGVTYYAKIVMVDELGNTSISAASSGLLLDPITGVTIQTSSVANTGIKMTNSSFTAYSAAGVPTFLINGATGEVTIAAYAAVFKLGATGTIASTGAATTGISISSPNSSFNTFIHPSGVEIRNDQTALSWWEADASDASLVNFFSPRAVIGQRLRIVDYEMLGEAKATGTRLVIRYKGA